MAERQRNDKDASPLDYGGLDPDLMKVHRSEPHTVYFHYNWHSQAIVSKIPPNRQTGRVDIQDVIRLVLSNPNSFFFSKTQGRYMSQNPTEMENLMTAMSSLDDTQEIDASSYDFAALASTIKHESFWVLQLENLGPVDASGKPADTPTSQNADVIQPSFIIYCYDDRETYRVTHECVGLPTSSTVLQLVSIPNPFSRDP